MNFRPLATMATYSRPIIIGNVLLHDVAGVTCNQLNHVIIVIVII